MHATRDCIVYILSVAWPPTFYTFWRQNFGLSLVKNIYYSNTRCRGSPKQSPWMSPSYNLHGLSIGGWLENYISTEPGLDATSCNTDEFHFYSFYSTSLPFTHLERGYKMKLLWHDKALYSIQDQGEWSPVRHTCDVSSYNKTCFRGVTPGLNSAQSELHLSLHLQHITCN